MTNRERVGWVRRLLGRSPSAGDAGPGAAAARIESLLAPAAEPPPQRAPGPAPVALPPMLPIDRGLEEGLESTRQSSVRRREVRGGGARVEIELWDGRRLPVVDTVLLGRNPGPRPGEPAPGGLLAIADPGRSVSKTHLLLGTDRHGLWIQDRDSTNGTVVTLADGQQILCPADQTVRVPVGASVAFGDYWLTVVA